MKTIPFLILLAVVATGGTLVGGPAPVASPAAATPKAAAPVLVELFTSQGCSSCPPADLLAAKLVREEGLVVISRPVTYWDRLGWRDTLAREANTQLQRDYASRGLAGENGVYTPQMVIDGRRGTVGSNESIVRQMIGHESGSPAAIALRKLDDGSLAIGLAGKTQGEAELVIVAIKSHVTVRIAAGENGNRAIGYTNVVVAEDAIAAWRGGKQGLRVSSGHLAVPGADRFALILRARAGGPVLAARMIG